MAYNRNSSTGHGTLTTAVVSPGVLRATMNHPPINLMGIQMMEDLTELLEALKATDEIKVLIVDSAINGYFIAHLDISLISAEHPPPADVDIGRIIGMYVQLTRTLSTIDVITIAEINGRAAGAGSELSVQFDMRFAGPDTRLSQLEDSLGVFPGGGGARFLVKLIGRGRAMEYVLAAKAADAKTAERIGWVNTAFDSVEAMRAHVDALAKRIALFSRDALIATKKSINYDRPTNEGMNEDVASFGQLMQTAESQRAISAFLGLSGAANGAEFEADVPESLAKLYK